MADLPPTMNTQPGVGPWQGPTYGWGFPASPPPPAAPVAPPIAPTGPVAPTTPDLRGSNPSGTNTGFAGVRENFNIVGGSGYGAGTNRLGPAGANVQGRDVYTGPVTNNAGVNRIGPSGANVSGGSPGVASGSDPYAGLAFHTPLRTSSTVPAKDVSLTVDPYYSQGIAPIGMGIMTAGDPSGLIGALYAGGSMMGYGTRTIPSLGKAVPGQPNPTTSNPGRGAATNAGTNRGAPSGGRNEGGSRDNGRDRSSSGPGSAGFGGGAGSNRAGSVSGNQHRAGGGDVGGLDDGSQHAFHAGGMLHSAVPGRTDHLPVAVNAGAYVIPADVVSGIGEGNSVAGAHVFDRMFGGPFHGKQSPTRTKGGPVDIIAAGGEYVVPPEAVTRIGGGDLKQGHSVLDRFVGHVRKKTAGTLRGLAPPVGSKK